VLKVAQEHQLLVVPRSPGPLRPLERAVEPADELDEIIDEVFGPTTDEGPGLFDVALVIGGIALVALSWISGGGGPWFAIGISAIILGIALPARSVIRAARDRRMGARKRRALKSGYALDVSDAGVAALAGSYDALRHAAGLPGESAGPVAIEAGHAAVLEVVSLLGGRSPLTEEEREYVERRTRAIRDLTAQLVKANRARERARLRDQIDATEPARARASAVARAREELEATTGLGAVDELERLRAQLRADGGTRDA
jgi:hypothetical protein